jgi:hypothetical protein
VSKHGSKERISQSIDGILGNLTIRGRSDGNENELQDLKRKLLAYEQLGSVEDLKKEKEEFLEIISRLKREQKEAKPLETLSLQERDKLAFKPSQKIAEYCEQSEGKRKLTIHLREIEYQAILKASQHLHSSKGQLMDTITKALRFYIPQEYYEQAEREVSLRAIELVRGMLEQLGVSQDEIERKIAEL